MPLTGLQVVTGGCLLHSWPLLTLVTPQFARSGQFVCCLEQGCSWDYQTVDLIHTIWGKFKVGSAVIDSP